MEGAQEQEAAAQDRGVRGADLEVLACLPSPHAGCADAAAASCDDCAAVLAGLPR